MGGSENLRGIKGTISLNVILSGAKDPKMHGCFAMLNMTNNRATVAEIDTTDLILRYLELIQKGFPCLRRQVVFTRNDKSKNRIKNINMFGLNDKQTRSKGEILNLKIEGMHCVSCSLNIDGTLEELDGVISSNTSYADAKSVVEFDPQKINRETIVQKISELGYPETKLVD